MCHADRCVSGGLARSPYTSIDYRLTLFAKFLDPLKHRMSLRSGFIEELSSVRQGATNDLRSLTASDDEAMGLRMDLFTT